MYTEREMERNGLPKYKMNHRLCRLCGDDFKLLCNETSGMQHVCLRCYYEYYDAKTVVSGQSLDEKIDRESAAQYH